MFSIIATFQPVLKTSRPAPASSAAIASRTTAGCSPRIVSGIAKNAMPIIPSLSGRFNGNHISTSVMSSTPTPSALITQPQPVIPRRSLFFAM
jgi:hypothetical protein